MKVKFKVQDRGAQKENGTDKTKNYYLYFLW